MKHKETEHLLSTEANKKRLFGDVKHKVESLSTEEVLANRSNAYEFIDFDKQETLEEALWKFNPLKKLDGEFLRGAFKEGAKWQKEQFTIEEQHIGHTIDELDKSYIKGFNEGAKWQQERSYSEEEVYRILRNFRTDFLTLGEVNDLTLNNWFEQFKKK